MLWVQRLSVKAIFFGSEKQSKGTLIHLVNRAWEHAPPPTHAASGTKVCSFTLLQMCGVAEHFITLLIWNIQRTHSPCLTIPVTWEILAGWTFWQSHLTKGCRGSSFCWYHWLMGWIQMQLQRCNHQLIHEAKDQEIPIFGSAIAHSD